MKVVKIKRKRYNRNYLLILSSRGARLKLDSNDYEEKIHDIGVALNRIPKYMESPEFRKALENKVVVISQSQAVKAFGRLAEQLRNIKLPKLSEASKEGLENYHYLNKLECLQSNRSIVRTLSSLHFCETIVSTTNQFV